MDDIVLRHSFSRVKDDVAYLSSLLAGHGNSIDELKILLRSMQYRLEGLETKGDSSDYSPDDGSQIEEVSQKLDNVEKEMLGTIKAVMQDVLSALKRLDNLEKRDIKQVIMPFADELQRAVEDINLLKEELKEIKSESLGQVYDRISMLEEGDSRLDMAQIHSKVNEISSQIKPLKDIAEHKVSEMAELKEIKDQLKEMERRVDELQEARLKDMAPVRQPNLSAHVAESFLNEIEAVKTLNPVVKDLDSMQSKVETNFKPGFETSVRLVRPDDDIKEKTIVLKQFSKSKKHIIQEKILEVIRLNELSLPQLKEVVVDHNNLCSKASFYRYFDNMKAKGLVDVKKDNGDEKVVVL